MKNERLGEMMNPCFREKEYNRYFEDTLSKEELVRLETHNKECKSCRAEFERWKALKESLIETTEVDVPSSLKTKVMNSIKKESIHNAEQPFSIKKIMVIAVLMSLVAAYYFLPFLRPYTSIISKEIVSYLSELFYSIISFVGLDVKFVITLFKALMSMLSNLYLVFAVSTFMLIVGFFSLIIKGNAKLNAN